MGIITLHIFLPSKQVFPVHPGAHLHTSGELHVPPL